MPWAAAAAIGGAVIGASATRSAAKTQAAAADRASDVQLQMFEQNREDMTPWREAGETALADLVAGTRAGGDYMRDFTAADMQRDPGYQFRLDQGQQALERSAAARGGALSGGSLKALTRYGQDYASGEYKNAYNRFNNDRTQRFNRLSSLAGIGQTANSQLANMGQQTAQNIGNNITSAANARASGYVGGANAISGGMNSLSNLYFMNQALNKGGSGVTADSPLTYGSTYGYQGTTLPNELRGSNNYGDF